MNATFGGTCICAVCAVCMHYVHMHYTHVKWPPKVAIACAMCVQVALKGQCMCCAFAEGKSVSIFGPNFVEISVQVSWNWFPNFVEISVQVWLVVAIRFPRNSGFVK